MPNRALLLLLLPALALADDEASQRRDRAKPALRPLIASHRKLARWCRTKGLKLESARHYLEVLQLEPDDASTRRALGHKKRKGGGWETAPLDLVESLDAGRRVKLMEELSARSVKHRATARDALADVARAHTKDGDGLGARRAWSRVLSFAPDHAEARAALGWERVDEKRWRRTKLAARLKAHDGGKALTEASLYATKVGVPLHGREGKTIQLWSHTAPRATDLLRHADTAAGLVVERLELPERTLLDVGWGLVFPDGRATHDKSIDLLCEGDEASKRWLKRLRGAWLDKAGLFAWVVDDLKDIGKSRDHATFTATDLMLSALAQGDVPPWLSVGLSTSMTLRLLGTNRTFFASKSEGSTTAMPGLDWNKPSDWQPLLRRMVLLDEPPRLRDALAVSELSALKGAHKAIAWSFARWTWDTEAARIKTYLELIAKQTKPGAAFTQAFGPIDDLERRWKDHVLANY